MDSKSAWNSAFFYTHIEFLHYLLVLFANFEADFLGFLQKLVSHRSLTLPFEPFGFWLRIRWDIRNRKTTRRRRVGDSPTRRVRESATFRLDESGSRWLADLASRRVGFWMFKRKLGESESRRLLDSVSWGVAMESLFEFFKIYHQITAL
jgi:hypothetical protein